MSNLPILQKYQIAAEIDQYKKRAFKRTSVSSYWKANAYKRNKGSASVPIAVLEKDRELANGSSFTLKKPCSTLKNEIVGAVVANAAGAVVDKFSEPR